MSSAAPYRSAGMPRRSGSTRLPSGRPAVPAQPPAGRARGGPGDALRPGPAARPGGGPATRAAAPRAAAARRADGRQGSVALAGRRVPRRAGAWERGLPLAPAVALVAVLAVFGAAVDSVTGPGLRTVFAVCMVLGSVLAAVLVRPCRLVALVATPPLVYAGLVLTAVGRSGPQPSMTRRAMQVFTEMVVSAPGMLLATLLALAVALVRGALLRTGDHRAAARAVHLPGTSAAR